MDIKLKKSEILFLYETAYNIPNGDPFTGEQRYDDETKKILVSDVRIKRYIRDYLSAKDGINIYVQKKDTVAIEESEETESTDAESDDKKGSGSARRIDELIKQFKPTETPVVEETTEKEEVPLREYRNYTKEELVSILTPEGIENILNLMKRLEELDQNPTKRKIGI